MGSTKEPIVRHVEILSVPSRDNGYRYVLRAEDGELVYLSGPGAPSGEKVGTKGTLTYRAGPSSGLFFWQRSE